MDKKTLVKRAQAFFFEAMLAGWVSGQLPVDRFEEDKPGFEIFKYGSVEFRLRDEFCSNGIFSSGQTTIWHKVYPIWTMQYGGWHNREVLDFLMKVLREQYEARIFTAGRGPSKSVWSGNHMYFNIVCKEGFAEFQGHEQIWSNEEGGECLGQYRYFGGSLI